jgi:OPA family glycerol-3-phosphate transporter-like MFS transporter
MRSGEGGGRWSGAASDRIKSMAERLSLACLANSSGCLIGGRGVGESKHVRRWQATTLVLLFVGYSGYYLCRSNLSVATPLLLDEMEIHGIARGDARVLLGRMVSFGTLAYAAGKFIFGATGDLIGGRRNFLGGMTGAVLFTVLFGLGGGLPVFTLAWVGNRFVQASGWPGLVKIGGRWFDYRWHGTAMAILSLSYLFGDAAARAYMGVLLQFGLGWRGLFYLTAITLFGLLAICFMFLKDSPLAIGAVEGTVSPANVYGDRTAPGVVAILMPLLRSPAFWYVCLLSLATTFLRETFNNWTPDYFKNALGFSPANAAKLSAGFPFLGGCSVILAGVLSDRLGRSGRAMIILVGLLLTGLLLLGLSQLSSPAATPWTAVAAVLFTGFLMLGPYSYLAGAVALDFGGKYGGATACGVIDGVGYLGGVYAGQGVAELVRDSGWPTAWGVLSAVAMAGCVAALFYWRDQARPFQPRPGLEVIP